MNNQTRMIARLFSISMLLTICWVQQGTAATVLEMDSSYEIVTHIVVGSNETGPKRVLSRSVAAALTGVKSDFDYQSFVTETSYFQSVGEGGSINFQGMTQSLGSMDAAENPIFLELSYGNFRIDEAVPGSVGFKSFNFQARLPIRYKGVEKNPENVSLVKYETIKIALVNIRLEVGTPKLIATMPLPHNGETIFFVVEVRKPGVA